MAGTDFNPEQFDAAVTRGRIRMAYSLNNDQPVICTIISDQPLFYMDEEMHEDEDGLFAEDALMNEFLAADLAELHSRIGVYDETAKSYERGNAERLEEFKNNIEQSPLTLDELIDLLGASRTGSELLALADRRAVKLAFSGQVLSSQYDKNMGVILINPRQTKGDLALSAITALRRMARHINGADTHPLSFHPDQAVVINRAQQADECVAMVRCAWELHLAGEQDAWHRIENSQMSDLGRALAREALCDFRSLNNGKAAQAVFETWFLSDRCKLHDRYLIQAMLADHEGLVFAAAQESAELSVQFLNRLGEQSVGKNYLAGFAAMVLSDPIFTDVRDRSNANFLWFIKFEKSFKETERALQPSEETIHKFGDQPAIFQNTEDTSENASASKIYQLPTRFKGTKGRVGRLEKGHDNTNVVYVSFDTAL